MAEDDSPDKDKGDGKVGGISPTGEVDLYGGSSGSPLLEIRVFPPRGGGGKVGGTSPSGEVDLYGKGGGGSLLLEIRVFAPGRGGDEKPPMKDITNESKPAQRSPVGEKDLSKEK